MPNPPDNPDPIPRHVLLAESDLFFSARIVSVLERLGYQVTTAGTREAAESALTSAPDLAMCSKAIAVVASKKVAPSRLMRSP